MVGRLDRKAGVSNKPVDLTGTIIPVSELAYNLSGFEKKFHDSKTGFVVNCDYEYTREKALFALMIHIDRLLTNNRHLLENAQINLIQYAYPYEKEGLNFLKELRDFFGRTDILQSELAINTGEEHGGIGLFKKQTTIIWNGSIYTYERDKPDDENLANGLVDLICDIAEKKNVAIKFDVSIKIFISGTMAAQDG